MRVWSNAGAAALAVVALSSCATSRGVQELPGHPRQSVRARQELLVQAAHDLIGVDQLFVGDAEYDTEDCTATVLAAYAAAGINLGAKFHRYRGNGVSRLYQMMRAHRLYYRANRRTRPAPGDVVFFDNTFDRNGNRRWDDKLTHMALVVAVDRHGTISYLHHHVRRGVIIEQMNLRHPDAPELNAPLRQKGSPRDGSGRYLASHLVRGFGRAYLLPT